MSSTCELKTPVALFVYRRHAELPALISRIRDARPSRVYLFADGPRDRDETEDCRRCRQLLDTAEWPCEVRRDYADTNLGCNDRLMSGLNLAFSECEELVVLEDDARLSGSFFRYCDDLLRYYRHEPSVMMISGLNPLGCWPVADGRDYLFSGIGNAQAWASWRRAWKHVESAGPAWRDPAGRRKVGEFIADEQQFRARARIYDLPDGSPDNSWDYRWALARQLVGGLCAVPQRSLAIHAGRGEAATHVKGRTIADELQLLSDVAFPLNHPERVSHNRAYDRFLYELTSNHMSDDSALRLAEMLIARDKRLLARAVLTHHFGASGQSHWNRLTA